MRFSTRIRCWEYRQLPEVLRISRPTRLDKAKMLGQKAKKGFVIYRVKIQRGNRWNRSHRGIVYGKPKNSGLRQRKARLNLQNLAEMKVGRALNSLRMLNSQWVAEDSKSKWFECIMVDPMMAQIRADPKINWICKLDKKRRDARGLTKAGRQHRGLLKKGDKAHKVRPSKRQSWIKRNTVKLLKWR